MATTNDKKTTLLGMVIGILFAGLGVFSYFTGFDASGLQEQVNASGDWGSLIMVCIGIFTAIKGYFTNKPDKAE